MKYFTKFLLSILLASSVQGFGQKYLTKNGFIRLYSLTPLETIDARNNQVNSVLDASTGDFVFKVLIRSFEFEKALMQEHFNENFMESDKIPNATFIGKVTNLKDINFTKKGTYNAIVEGKLTIHGVTHEVKEQGTFDVNGDKVTGKSKFNLLPGDYDIKIPNTIINKIADHIEVTVNVPLEKIK